MSEDCLFVNVWTPTSQKGAKLPVLFWIHGGGWQGGSGYHPAYDGEQFAGHGVVVVTFNYRVGLFGFLAHSGLTKESSTRASGNYGLLDQLAALKWVQRNIEQFGGDPTKVTIAGESAGSYSVSALTASPLSRSLFRGAIAESGAYVMPQRDAIRSLQDSEKIGLEFTRSIGTDDIASLRAMSAENLMKAVGKMTDFFAFQPCVDGYFLPEPVYATYAKHQQANVPVLIGSNTDEGAFLLPTQRPTENVLKAQIDRTFGAKSSVVRDIYPMATPSDRLRSELNLYADVTFTYPMWKWASMNRQQGLPVYYYLFGRVLPPLPQQTYKGIPRDSIGAFHGDEMPYVFGNLNLVKSMLDSAPREGRLERSDHELSNTMLNYWVNFVKTGNPNGAGLPHWPGYDGGTEDSLMYFDKDTEARRDARTGRLKILDAALQP
jgi:para-nitrobenzyl esterase